MDGNKTKRIKKIASVGVVGLGFMGSAISASILKEGFHLTGFDIAAERMALLVERGGEAAPLPGKLRKRLT